MQTNGATHDPSPKHIDATVVDLFDAWAARDPDRLAAEWQGEQLTYAELRASSLHVSRALLSAGVRPRDRVPLLTEMSLAMLPAVIGILRVGACYVPIDVAAWSSTRVESILADTSPTVAVVTSPCPSVPLPPVTVNFQKAWLHAPFVDDDSGLDARLDEIKNGMLEDDLAWIVFTSGTTGRPKGVMIYHRGIYAVSRVKMGDELVEAAEQGGGRCLLAYSIAFDGKSPVPRTANQDVITDNICATTIRLCRSCLDNSGIGR